MTYSLITLLLATTLKSATQTHVSDSVVLPNVKIGKGCEIRKAIIDKRVEIAPGTRIGVNLEEDHKRFKVTDSSIVSDSSR